MSTKIFGRENSAINWSKLKSSLISLDIYIYR